MADLLLERFGGFLPAIMPRVFTSCESDKSLQADVADEGPVVWEEEDGDEGEGAEGAGPLGYFVMTSYLREQEAACNLLGVLADRTSTAFVEYIDNAYKICMEFTTVGERKTTTIAHSALSDLEANRFLLSLSLPPLSLARTHTNSASRLGTLPSAKPCLGRC